MTGTSQSAVAAALAVARAQGARCEEPVVLRDAWHVLVYLRPLPVVARVSSGTPFPQGPRPDDVVRELEVAGHAARAGAPVVPPSDEVDPGPHRHDGHIVTFWRHIEPRGQVDPRWAGRGLRLIHDALLDYDGALPPAGHGEDVGEMLASVEGSADVELLRELAARRPHGGRGQSLHGDAHLANCLSSPSGPLWHDFESTCSGPREYDLAALVLRDRWSGFPPAREALSAYGAHDAELLDALVPVYAAWVYASFLVALPRRPELEPVVRERLQWLRRYVSAKVRD